MKKSRRVLALFISIFLRNRFLNTARWFCGKKHRIGKGNLYLNENPLSKNEIWCVTDDHTDMCHISGVIYGPPVTTESRARFESGFGYFEVFRKKWAPMSLAKVWAKPRRGQNPKWPPAAILEIPKSAILRRFYTKSTIKVSILTNFMVRNPFQGLVF